MPMIRTFLAASADSIKECQRWTWRARAPRCSQSGGRSEADGAQLGRGNGTPAAQAGRNTCGAGRRTSAAVRQSASTTARCPNWTTGSGGESACATGNSGAGCARRSSSCWPWAEDRGSKSTCADLDGPRGRSSATAACKAEPEDGDPAWRQQQEVSRTRNSPGNCFSPANGTWREPRRCSRRCPTRG